MPWRRFSTACILALGAAAIFLAFGYGPSRRTYFAPPRVVTVGTAEDAYDVWQANGIRGRIVLVLARRLIPAEFGLTDAERAASAPEVEAIERAMHHGILRGVYHVVPDDRWSALARALPHDPIYWPTDRGFVAAFEDGRVNVLPRGRLRPIPEKVLLLLDPRIWSQDELDGIARLIRTGAVRTDLVAILDGTSSDLELLRSALAAAAD